MIKAIIFDLDSCLAAADEVGEQLSFCNAGIHATSTVAARMRSRRAVICSTRASNAGVMVNSG